MSPPALPPDDGRPPPSWATNVTGIAFALPPALKVFEPNDLCLPTAWDDAAGVMAGLETALAVLFLWRNGPHRLASLLGTGIMAGAALVLTLAELRGVDVSGCRCFGPLRLSYGPHMGVISLYIALCIACIVRGEGAPRTDGAGWVVVAQGRAKGTGRPRPDAPGVPPPGAG